jgi:hypothetical protein
MRSDKGSIPKRRREMKDPPRLLEQGATQAERNLLRAGLEENPPARFKLMESAAK